MAREDPPPVAGDHQAGADPGLIYDRLIGEECPGGEPPAIQQPTPEALTRSQQIARIIDPAAFLGNWNGADQPTEQPMDARNGLRQARAIGKAQEVLEYLGLNPREER